MGGVVFGFRPNKGYPKYIYIYIYRYTCIYIYIYYLDFNFGKSMGFPLNPPKVQLLEGGSKFNF